MSEQQKLFDLLRAGVTPFMCVDECERRLVEADFEKMIVENSDKIFGSTVFFSLKGDYPFNITEVGEYEIKIKVQYKVNGELRESDNTFSFRIV